VYQKTNVEISWNRKSYFIEESDMLSYSFPIFVRDITPSDSFTKLKKMTAANQYVYQESVLSAT
jgi:hypothetical protein